jgi:ABC-2 type transport system permease protein
MRALLSKEINSFFASVTGYLVIAIFLLTNGLFLWVFDGSFNIFQSGFADLSPFFELAPWVFIFLIPAITMRSFSEEKKQGTMEILLTRPLSTHKIVLGKYLGAFCLVLMALLPTLLYIWTINNLGDPAGNYDVGATLGSYIGLVFLGAVYTAIGIFSSVITKNQIVAFIIGVFLCFLIYFGFQGISNFELFGSEIYALEYLGISFHYQSISRGVVDTRNLVYFLSLIILFLGLTHFKLQKRN